MKKKIILIITLFLFLLLGFWQKFYAFTPLESLDRTIKVHIDGAVASPGVYELSDEGRLEDLLELAGGLSEHADGARLNYAQRLLDGEKIVVPEVILSVEEEGDETITKTSGLQGMSMEDWTAIKGVGEKTAGLIMSYLEDHPGAVLDDLIHVSGVGPSKLKDIKDALEP